MLSVVASRNESPPINPVISRSGKGILFISYNGLLDPLGGSQILPYLERLNRTWPVHILTYDRADKVQDSIARRSLSDRLRTGHIGWTTLRYHKWPSLPATTYDVVLGQLVAKRLVRAKNIGLIHCRGYVPMTVGIGLSRDVPLLFDIRGLQAEEYVDGGTWRAGELKWSLAKTFERKFLQRAAAAVVLTNNIKPHVSDLFAREGRAVPIEVIPCCVDLDRFRIDESARQRVRSDLGIDSETIVLVYSGTLGTWYRPKEMARFARTFRDISRKPTCLLWLVNNDHELAREASTAAELQPHEYRITSATSLDVPAFLSASNCALALIAPTFSKRASSPTKYAECLAMGLPLVIHGTVGDGQEIVARKGAVSLPFPCSDEQMANAARQLLSLMRLTADHFRRIASDLFDIDRVALPRYESLYRSLLRG